ncbi:MAG: hypothetical protein R2764_23140 [Bacteroidales bacterium]
MKNIFDNIGFLKNKQLGCIEVSLRDDNSCIYHLVLLKQEKNKINLEKVVCSIESFEELYSNLSRNIPLVIVFTGKGIIFRDITSTDNENDVDILRKILPNAKFEDFYVEKTETESDEIGISIIRKK